VVCGAAALAQNQPAATPVSQASVRLPYGKEVLIQLAVSDLERAMKFYGETLELELVWSSEELKWAEYKTNVPGIHIGVGVQDDVQGSGTVSVNLGVRDLDQARAVLEKKGVNFPKPSVNIPGVVKLADFTDPDGNRFRLAGPPDPAETE